MIHYWDYILSVVHSKKYLVETEDSDDDNYNEYEYEEDPYDHAEYDDPSSGATVPAERCNWNKWIQRHVNAAGQTIETQYGVDR